MSQIGSPRGRVKPKSRTECAEQPDFDLGWIGRSTGRAERRQMVVLAIGFATVGAADPEELVERVAGRRSFVSSILSRFGGTLGRIDPDRQLVTWGWPVASEADARMAVSAALEIAAGTADVVRCGIDAGIAVTPEAEDQLSGIGVVGEVLAKATALQRAAPERGVAVSETLRRLIGESFELVELENTQQLTRAWQVVQPAPRPDSDWVTDADASIPRLVGRVAEMSVLLDNWRKASRGRACWLRLEGEAGVGKSALVAHLQRSARDEGASLVAVQCLPETQHVPLEPIRKMIDALAQIAGNRDAARPADTREARNVLPLMEGVASLPSCLAEAVRDYSASIVRLRPVLLVVEDAQWSDTGSLAAIGAIGRLLESCDRILLVTTQRPNASDAALSNAIGSGRCLQVGALPAFEIDRLLAGGDAGARLAPEIRRRIADHADGIPGHALELAQLCLEAPDSDAHHRLLSAPNRLNAALTSRLDALATMKPLAQAAAVLGRELDCRVLAAMLGMDARILAERLDMLVEQGILKRCAERTPSLYRFTHALLWSQAYGSVLKARRRQLHAKAAAILVGDFPTLAAAESHHVAHHYKKAGDHKSAFGWWRLAAYSASANGLSASAVDHISQALLAKSEAPDVCDTVEEAELLRLLGAQLGPLRGDASRETVAAYERALELMESLPARPADLGFDIGWGLAAIHLVRGNVRDASILSERLLEEARETQRDDALLLALRMHGTARLLSGRVIEAIELLTHAADLYVPALHGGLRVRYVSDPGAVALAHLGSAQALAGQVEAARRTRNRALTLAAQIKHPHTSANVLGVLAFAAIHLDEPGVAIALARASDAIARQQGYAYWAARAGLVIAWEEARRTPATGFARMGDALEQYRKTGAGRASVLAHCLAGDVAIRAGDMRTALELLDPVSDRGETHGEWIYMSEIKRLKALALALGQPAATKTPQVLQLLADAEALAGEHGALALAEHARRDLAVYLERGVRRAR